MGHITTSPQYALINGFAALGAVGSVLITRQPEFFKRWQLTSGDWGWVLFAAGLGGVLAYPVNRWVLHHWGSRSMLYRFGTAGGLLLALIPWLPGLPALWAGVFLQGAIYSSVGVAINHQASEWELHRGQRMMGRLHATFFMGSVLSALLSGLLVTLEVGLALHMAGVGLVAAWLHRRASLSLAVLPTQPPADAGVTPHGKGGGLALGLLLGWCTALESGVMGWASVYLHQGLKAGESVSGVGLAAFSGAMAVGRMFSDHLVSRHGAARLVRTGAALCAAALALAAAIQQMPVAFLAFAATGLGLAAAAPTIFSAAGRMSGQTLALVAAMGTMGGLVGPLILGRIATLLSLNWVLAALAAVSVVIAWQAKALAGGRSNPSNLSMATP